MNESSHIVGTVEVVHQEPTGIIALVNGQRQTFPDLDAVFRTAIGLLDERGQPHAGPGPPPQQPLPGLAP
jgi:hypothetical protein